MHTCSIIESMLSHSLNTALAPGVIVQKEKRSGHQQVPPPTSSSSSFRCHVHRRRRRKKRRKLICLICFPIPSVGTFALSFSLSLLLYLTFIISCPYLKRLKRTNTSNELSKLLTTIEESIIILTSTISLSSSSFQFNVYLS